MILLKIGLYKVLLGKIKALKVMLTKIQLVNKYHVKLIYIAEFILF